MDANKQLMAYLQRFAEVTEEEFNQYLLPVCKVRKFAKKEVLTEAQKINEYIMTSLRTMEGIDLDLIRLKFGENTARGLQKKAGRFPPEHVLTENSFLRLTNAGKLFADGIAAELFEE